jgi:hypothetical protein
VSAAIGFLAAAMCASAKKDAQGEGNMGNQRLVDGNSKLSWYSLQYMEQLKSNKI